MTESPVFVVIEGLDGTGKSTLCRMLAHRLGAVSMATPLPELAGIRALADGTFDIDPLARKCWYAAHVAAASARVRQYLEQRKNVVMDRYWLSTLAYSAADGENSDFSGVERGLVPADVTFFLDLSLEKRSQRLMQRDRLLPHDIRTLGRKRSLALRRSFLALSGNRVAGLMVRIDTGEGAPDKCVEQMTHIIGKAGYHNTVEVCCA